MKEVPDVEASRMGLWRPELRSLDFVPRVEGSFILTSRAPESQGRRVLGVSETNELTSDWTCKDLVG